MERTAAASWVTDALVAWVDQLAHRGVFVTDSSMAIRSWNRWLVMHSGRSADDVIGRPLYDVFPDLLDRGFDAYYADALAGEPRVLSEAFHRYFIPMRRTIGGTPFDMAQSIRIEPLRVDGAVTGTVTVIEDVTERVITERELRSRIAAADSARQLAEEASHLKDDFLAALSHEIRTPLNSVIGWARVLQLRGAAPAEPLQVIERNSLKQLQIVDDLLAMSRVISGRLRLSIRPTDVPALVRDVIDSLTPAIDARRLVLTLHCADDLPLVAADPGRLQQAVGNVISNAVKFTEPGGAIDLAIACEDGHVTVRVSDNGVGIPRSFLPHVFELFRQADASPSRIHDGLGIGLALARRIVELHGGDIRAESEGPDRGTTFWISLPVQGSAHAHPAAIPPRTVHPVNTLGGCRVVVIERDPDASALVAAMLADYGADVRCCTTSDDVHALVAHQRFDPNVVLADIDDEPDFGSALLRSLRHNAGSRTLRAIAISDHGGDGMRIRALAAGYLDHLPKPFQPATLASAVAAVLS